MSSKEVQIVSAEGKLKIDGNEAKLARAFAKELRESLKPEQMKEIIEKNRRMEYLGCCASHDYCDANVVMMDAFEKAFGREMKLGDEDPDGKETDLVNASWTIAKHAEFREDWILYTEILDEATRMMGDFDDLEPTSAYKEAAAAAGIEWGDPMGAFVEWARKEIRGEPHE